MPINVKKLEELGVAMHIPTTTIAELTKLANAAGVELQIGAKMRAVTLDDVEPIEIYYKDILSSELTTCAPWLEVKVHGDEWGLPVEGWMLRKIANNSITASPEDLLPLDVRKHITKHIIENS